MSVAVDLKPWTACADKQEAYLLGMRAGRLAATINAIKGDLPWSHGTVAHQIIRLLEHQPLQCRAEIAHALGMGDKKGSNHVASRLSDLRRQGRVNYTEIGRLWYVVAQEEAA